MDHDNDAELERLLRRANDSAQAVLNERIDVARRLAELRGEVKPEHESGEAAP